MHRVLSWFMVLLLALRGLLGDTMAMELMPLAQASQAGVAHHGLHHPPQLATQPDDPPCGTALHASTQGPQHCGDHSQNPPCGNCGACHSTWTLPGMSFTPLSAPHATTPRYEASALVSAPVHNLTKPPIA